ncbi:Metal dependent hydrolase [Entamoeba marina]
MPITVNNTIIHHTGHAGFFIESEDITIYIDPFKLNELPQEQLEYVKSHKANFIVTTHSHFDHLSKEDIELISNESTIILGPTACEELIKDHEFVTINVGDKIEKSNVLFEAVAAYNNDKKFHTKEMGFIGIVITVNGTRMYHTGDTDMIEEMKFIGSVDIAFIPVSGTYVMTPEQAIKATKFIQANQFVPMHWGKIVGDEPMAKTFLQSVKGAIMPTF